MCSEGVSVLYLARRITKNMYNVRLTGNEKRISKGWNYWMCDDNIQGMQRGTANQGEVIGKCPEERPNLSDAVIKKETSTKMYTPF